jgi:hypothetical protein
MTRRSACLLLLMPLVVTFTAGCAESSLPPPSGSVLFQDDFSRPSSGWEIRRRAEAIFDYRDGEYTMLVLAPNASTWSTPRLEVGEVRIEVDARQTGGRADNLYGIICRYRNDGNFAFLVASGDGFAGIGEYRNGRRQLLSGDAMLPADSIILGGLPNHLSAECLADTLRLYINGNLAVEVESKSVVPQSGIGLLVGSYGEPGVEFAFDNFSARAP